VALTLFAAVLFGMLAGLDARFEGRRLAPAFCIAAAAAGWLTGLLWSAFAPEDWSFSSPWVELSAACCVFALAFGGDERADFDNFSAQEGRRDAYWLRSFQALAFGIAIAVGAWAYCLAFLAFMLAGHALEAWLTCLLRIDGAGEAAAPQSARVPAGQADAGAPEWLETAPRSFIAALNAAYRHELAETPGSSFRAPRHIRVAHNAAKPLDARSAASTRSIARGNGTAGPRKIPTEARDRAPGRR